MYLLKDARTNRYGFWSNNSWAIEPVFLDARGFVGGYSVVTVEDGTSKLLALNGDIIDVVERLPDGDSLQNARIVLGGFCSFDGWPSDYSLVGVKDHRTNSMKLSYIDNFMRYHNIGLDVGSNISKIYSYDNYVVVYKNDRQGKSAEVYDIKLGRTVIDKGLLFSMIYPSRELYWVVSRHAESIDGRSSQFEDAFLDINLLEIVSDWFWTAFPFCNGRGAVREYNTGSYFIDAKMNNPFNQTFDNVGQFWFGYASVSKGDLVGFIDKNGNVFSTNSYDRICDFNRFGYAVAVHESPTDTASCDIISSIAEKVLTGLQGADFIDGDFPYYIAEYDGSKVCLNENFDKIYEVKESE